MDLTKIGCQQIVSNPASILDHDFGQADDRCDRRPEFLTREGGKGTFKALARFRHGALSYPRARTRRASIFSSKRGISIGLVS